MLARITTSTTLICHRSMITSITLITLITTSTTLIKSHGATNAPAASLGLGGSTGQVRQPVPLSLQLRLHVFQSPPAKPRRVLSDSRRKQTCESHRRWMKRAAYGKHDAPSFVDALLKRLLKRTTVSAVGVIQTSGGWRLTPEMCLDAMRVIPTVASNY